MAVTVTTLFRTLTALLSGTYALKPSYNHLRTSTTSKQEAFEGLG